MNIKNSVLNYVRYKQSDWYGHVRRRIKIGYLKKKNKKEFCSPGRRRRRRKGRLRNSWMLKVTTGMREKGINNI